MVPSVLEWGAPGTHSGHHPHLDSWHYLDLLCSLTSGYGPQTSAFPCWFLELLWEKWRGNLDGILWHSHGPSEMVRGVDSEVTPLCAGRSHQGSLVVFTFPLLAWSLTFGGLR